MAAGGLTTIESSYGPEDTMNRFEAEVRATGMTVFAHIDHAERSAGVGVFLRPTELLVFGDDSRGTSLTNLNQLIGIDLPLKALVWQDASGTTWLTYYEPGWLAERHGLGDQENETIGAMTRTLRTLAKAATGTSMACRLSQAKLSGPDLFDEQDVHK
jgi:uncharacterized protein (DUF302 family)